MALRLVRSVRMKALITVKNSSWLPKKSGKTSLKPSSTTSSARPKLRRNIVFSMESSAKRWLNSSLSLRTWSRQFKPWKTPSLEEHSLKYASNALRSSSMSPSWRRATSAKRHRSFSESSSMETSISSVSFTEEKSCQRQSSSLSSTHCSESVISTTTSVTSESKVPSIWWTKSEKTSKTE